MEKTRREFLSEMGKAGAFVGLWETIGTPVRRQGSGLPLSADPQQHLSELKAGWLAPSRTYRPHTRWWWPGSAVTTEGITWELQQMSAQGMGGVEIMIPWEMYAKGNIPYLSEEWLRMVRHAISKARELDMEVAVTFSPGWSFGGFWVPPGERSKMLTQGWVDVSGPADLDREIPPMGPIADTDPLPKSFHSEALDEDSVVAVMAAKVAGTGLDADTLVNLSRQVSQGRLKWHVPPGRWRLMAFRLKYTGQLCETTENFVQPQWVIDHLSKKAVSNYCDHLGGILYQAFGEEFGKTVDSMFCDSFEVFCRKGSLLWSSDTLERFAAYKGYDLTRYLPAIWWDIGELTAKIRYDVGDFLSWLGLDTFFKTFVGWCKDHNTQARIQPHYRFTEELIEGAGMTPRPEMEVTTMRFAVVADPRKAIAAGAHFYGSKIVSVEAYTFLHIERYRTTLEEMKIATDAFLRDGAAQFYNHGYTYSPEMHVAPSRDVPMANRISHWNTWWKHYHHLSEYVSRCCFLLRQGNFVGDVLVYSPQATVWAEKALFVNERRNVPYGDLPKTLVANGYDFDPVNDDVLQHRARVESGQIKVRDLSYRFLILPKTTAMPVATMEFIRQFAMGGGIVIALDELPASSVGLNNYQQNDQRVKQLVRELFGLDGMGQPLAGGGRTYYLPNYKIVEPRFDPLSQPPYEPTPPLQGGRAELIETLRSHFLPDFALEGNQQSDGLTFIHRRMDVNDIYFVTNHQPNASRMAVTFRAEGKVPEEWDPRTGKILPVFHYRPHESGVEVSLNLPPYASTFLIFKPSPAHPYVSETNLDRVLEVNPRQVNGIVSQNGKAQATVMQDGKNRSAEISVSDLAKPYEVSGAWQMVLEGYQFSKLEKTVSKLESWTEDPRSEHFSGTGHYDLDFQLPDEYVSNGTELVLDLGSVGNVAEVIVNGKNVGVAWMQPYQLPVTEALRSGPNHLTILVTNTLINYVSGLSKLPDVPDDLVPHYGTTAHIYDDGAVLWKDCEKGFHPLPPSGLMGPVRIITQRKVTLML
jgi:hypothetical protein